MAGESSQASLGASSSSVSRNETVLALDDLDGDEAADLSLDNAFLADDPLASDDEQTRSATR